MTNSFFAPHLAIKDVSKAIEFYIHAFDATVLRKWPNPDGSIHVAELEIEGAMFHLHEESPASDQLGAETLRATSVVIGFFTEMPDQLILRAEQAGGIITRKMQDYDYGYRQGTLQDPFGHQWLIQKNIQVLT